MPGVERYCRKCRREVALPGGEQTIYEGKKWCECDLNSENKVDKIISDSVKGIKTPTKEEEKIVLDSISESNEGDKK